MTAATSPGTPLILIVLALGISFLSAVGSIAAVLMARANVQRQLQVAAREAWRREFREQVAALLAWQFELQQVGRASALLTREIDQATQDLARRRRD